MKFPITSLSAARGGLIDLSGKTQAVLTAFMTRSGGIHFSLHGEANPFVGFLPAGSQISMSFAVSLRDAGGTVLLTCNYSGTYQSSAFNDKVSPQPMTLVSETFSHTPSGIATLPSPNSASRDANWPAYRKVTAQWWPRGDSKNDIYLNVSTPAYLVVVPVGSYVTIDSHTVSCSAGGNPRPTTRRVRAAERPVPRFTHTVDGATVNFNGSTSYIYNYDDPDNSIAQWVWNFGDGETGTRETGTGVKPSHEYPSDDTYNVKLEVFDIYGGSQDITRPVIPGASSVIDMLVDRFHAMLTAVKSPDQSNAIQLLQFKAGVSSREVIFTLPNARNGRICKDIHNTLYLLSQDATDKIWRLRSSYNNGKNFDIMATMWGPEFKFADLEFIAGGSVTCATKNVNNASGVSVKSLHFKYSPDGITWPGDTQAVLISDALGQAGLFVIEQNAETGQLRIYGRDKDSNNAAIDRLWISTSTIGKAGSWNPA